MLTASAEHELPGTARHDPLVYLHNRSVDWLDHQLAARELLSIDPVKTVLVLEDEFPNGRFQDRARMGRYWRGRWRMCVLSIRRLRRCIRCSMMYWVRW
jgi:hypothetical protein